MSAPGPLSGLAVGGCGVARCGRSEAGGLLERPNGLVATARSGPLSLQELLSETSFLARRGLAPDREALRRSLQAVERAECRFAATGRVRQLILGPLPLLEQRRQLLVGAAAGDRRRARGR